MLRALAWATFAFVSGGAIAFGCQKSDERPPNVDTECEAGIKCGEPPPVGSGSGGSGGLDAQGDVGPSTTITGTIAVVTSDDFTTATPLTQTATVELEDPTGAPVTGSYDGSTFSVSGAAQASGLWAIVSPELGGDPMVTLQPIDTTLAGPFQLLVVNRSVLELVYGVLTIPTTPATGTAQVVLQFLSSQDGKPLPGVTVTHDAAEAIAYDVAGSYSDAVTETSARGIAVLTNVPAVTKPAKQKVQIQTATATGAIEILMQADAITLTDVLIDP